MRIAISFSDSALSDLFEIKDWYAEQGAPEIGERMVSEIVERVEMLTDHPELGRVVPEFGLTTIRELTYPPFRIVYRQDSAQVRVVRVWRSERLLRLAPEEGSPEA